MLLIFRMIWEKSGVEMNQSGVISGLHVESYLERLEHKESQCILARRDSSGVMDIF